MANRFLLNSDALKISKNGVDVLTATGASNFIFNSDYLACRTFLRGSVSVPTKSSATVSYGVTLTGSPLGIFYVQIGSDYVHPMLQPYTAASTGLMSYRAYFSTTNVIFYNTTSTTRTFHYAILELET